MSNETEARRHKNVVYFKRGELDFVLQTALSTAASDSAAIGEVFYAASRINEKERDLESWIREWHALGKRVEEIARRCLGKGHRVSAREAFLRAFNYYRIATYLMRVGDPSYREAVTHFRDCFQQAIALFDPPFEKIGIACEGTRLPGYFFKACKSDEPRPTILLFSGGESFCEEVYIWFGPAALRREYNLLAFDLPGQGITALEGLHFRHDVEVPVGAAIDYLVSRPDVDARKIVASGVSYGGYATMRAAAHDKRLAAISASTPLIDFQKLINENAPWLGKVPAFAGNAAVRMLGRIDPFAMVVYEKFLASCGIEKPSEGTTAFEEWNVDVKQIACPVLCMVGAGEHESFQWQARTAYERLVAPGKQLRVFEVAEGADAHCQANNIPLGTQEVFDFFDEVLAG
jgi:dienelactone hydrolase